MKSLQDQLLKAGLVDKNTARQTAKTKHRQAKADRKTGGQKTDADSSGANAMRERNADRDRALNRQKQQHQEQKAIAAQIRQLVELNQLPVGDGSTTYNFVFDNKIKQLDITDVQHKALTCGRVSIVALPGKNHPQFHLVPRAVADKIAERDQTVIVDHDKRAASEDDQDDTYAEYTVPDDLMW